VERLYFSLCVDIYDFIRGDIVEPEFALLFSCPCSAQILVCGKYLSGLVCAVLLFGASTADRFSFFTTLGVFSELAIYIWRPGLDADHFVLRLPGWDAWVYGSILFVDRSLFS